MSRVRDRQRCKHSRYRNNHRMAPSSYPYPCPVESDGDQSGRDEGQAFRCRVNRPNRQVESEIQLRHQLRLAWQDPTQGSDEGDGGSLFNYVNSAPKWTPGPGDAEPGVQSFGDIWEADGTLRRSLFISA
jgi:hypothetical protein